jgi:uncharacterized protein YajQ (UPF0234 family)
MKHINKFDELNEAVNPEALAAIDVANKDYGFKFDIKNRKGGSYWQDANSTVPIWESVQYSLYKVQGTTWKVAMDITCKKNVKKANRRLDLFWFDIDKSYLKA